MQLKQGRFWLRGLLADADLVPFDRALADMLADHPDATHVPATMLFDGRVMAEDGFHPGAKVYAEWARVLAQHITAK